MVCFLMGLHSTVASSKNSPMERSVKNHAEVAKTTESRSPFSGWKTVVLSEFKVQDPSLGVWFRLKSG